MKEKKPSKLAYIFYEMRRIGIIKNSLDKICELANVFLEDKNIIGLYVECNDIPIPHSFDGEKPTPNPQVTLVAVFKNFKEEYKTKGNSVCIKSLMTSKTGDISINSLYVPMSSFISDDRIHTYVENRACLSLSKGIIMYDKLGLLTDATQNIEELVPMHKFRRKVQRPMNMIDSYFGNNLPVIAEDCVPKQYKI